MMRITNRYKVIKATRDQGQVHGYSIRDTWYPIISYPFYETRKEAETIIAAKYSLTLEEYRREKKR